MFWCLDRSRSHLTNVPHPNFFFYPIWHLSSFIKTLTLGGKGKPPPPESYLIQILGALHCMEWNCTAQSLQIPSANTPALLSPLISCCSPALFFVEDNKQAPTRCFACAPRRNRSAEGQKLFDGVLIWDCQTSRDDKVHTWEQSGSLLCIFCSDHLCGAKWCIHQSGITWSCHHSWWDAIIWSPILSRHIQYGSNSNGIVKSSVLYQHAVHHV